MADAKEVTPIDTQDTLVGKLYKKGKINRAWKTRYFIGSRSLQSIRYYEKESDLNQTKKEKGQIDLTAVCRIETNAYGLEEELPQYIVYNRKLKSDKRYSFQLVSASRTYVLATHNPSQLLKWLSFLYSCLYAAEVIKSGYLKVQERKQKPFQSRYFVLNALQQLKSYDNEHLETCLGTIDCNKITKIDDNKVSTHTISTGYVFDIHIETRILAVAANSQHERSEWVRSIEMMQNDRWKYQLSKQKSLKINKRPKDDDSGFLERPVQPMPHTDDSKEDSCEPLKINKRPMHDDSGFLERPSIPKEDVDNEPYSKRNEAAISQWFGSERLAMYCDKKKRSEDEKENDFRDCYAVNRIAMVMASAKENMQTTFGGFFEKEAIYSITALLNDYHHILESHDVELEALRYYLISKHELNCAQSQCDYLTRNYRNRAQFTKDDEMQLYATAVGDAKRMLMNKQLDKMHAYLMHSFDLNYRLTKKEGLQIFGPKTEDKKHDAEAEEDQKRDAEDEEEEDAEDEDLHEGQTIEKMQKVIESKRTKMRQLVGDERMANNKFVTKVVSEKETDEKQSAEVNKQVSATEYSFGFPFKYYPRFQHGKWFIRKKHSDMKQELLKNPFVALSLSQYQSQLDASNAFLQCNSIKRLKCSHIRGSSEPQAADTGIADKSPITVPHLLALLFYCNFTELCTAFSSTFRRIRHDETDEGVKERNAHFFHWSKLLLEAIHLFGTPLTAKAFGTCAYHGVSRIMVFDSMNQGVFGPFSTTSQFNVALQFASSGGLVLTLSRSSDIKKNKYFDCAFISDFGGESEKLFLNGLLQIDNILHVASKHSYGWFCRAFKVLTSMLHSTPVNSRIVRKKHAAFYLSMMKEGHEPYPEYVEALWKHTVRSIKEVNIDLQLMNVVKVDTDVEVAGAWYLKFKQRMQGQVTECDKWGYRLVNEFVMLENGWIHLKRLCQLLPNLEVVYLERYKRSDYGNKSVESVRLNEALIERFLEYQPPVSISIAIDKPSELDMSASSFVAKCRETQKGKINKTFAVLSGTVNKDKDWKLIWIQYNDTPLYQACANGDHEVVLQLVQSEDEAVKATINEPSRYNKATPLFIAVDQGHLKCVEHMLSNEAVSINALSRYKSNAFMVAIARGNNEIARMLLDHSDKMKKKGIKHGILDVNHVDDDGSSALHSAAITNNQEIIDALIKLNINPDLQDSDRETALHKACEKQHTQIMELLLQNAKANPDIQSLYGKTPLMGAITERYTQGIELLLKYGADANKINEHDADNAAATALYYAIKKKTRKTVSLLLDSGADPAKIDANGQTLLHTAVGEAQSETLQILFEAVSARMNKEELAAFVNKKDTDGDTALHTACSDEERKDCAEYLLENTPCDVNVLNNKGRPALAAALGDPGENTYGASEIAQMLLAAGAKTDTFDASSKTLLYGPVIWGEIDLLKAVYDNYLKSSNLEEATRFVNHVDDEGKTVLHVACEGSLGKTVECVQYLIEVGANIDVYDKDGGTLFHAVVRGGGECETMKAIYDTIDWDWDDEKTKAFVNHSDHKHETALFACAYDVEKAKYLLSIGGEIDPRCDINAVGKKYKQTALSDAAGAGCLELVNVLLDAGAKIDTFDWQKESPLYKAAEEPSFEVLKVIYHRYLQNTDYAAATKFVNHRNKHQETALFPAVRESLECAEFLLSVGAEICIFDDSGMSPITKASAFGEPESLKCVYNHYLKSTDLATATRLVNRKDKEKKSALSHGAELGYIECVEFLLSVGATASVSDVDKEGNSLLHLSSQGGSAKCMKAIYESISQNINENEAKKFVNLRNQNGQTALLVAAEYDKDKIIEYLYTIGAALDVFEGVKGRSVFHIRADQEEINITQMVYELYLKDTNLSEATALVNAKDFNNCTMLHLACDGKCTDKVKYFLENTQCDVNLKNNNSETPLMIAARKGYTDIVKLVLGAKGVELVDDHSNCEALRLAKQKKKECADAIEACLMETLSEDKAAEIIEKYPENYPDDDDDDDCLIM